MRSKENSCNKNKHTLWLIENSFVFTANVISSSGVMNAAAILPATVNTIPFSSPQQQQHHHQQQQRQHQQQDVDVSVEVDHGEDQQQYRLGIKKMLQWYSNSVGYWKQGMGSGSRSRRIRCFCLDPDSVSEHGSRILLLAIKVHRK